MADRGSNTEGGPHPLTESMASAGTLGAFFAIPQGQAGEGSWTRARDLFQGDDRRLSELVATYGLRAWESSNRHVAASAFLVAYLSRVVFPLVGQYVLAGRAPDVSLDNLAFHWNGPAIDATGLERLRFAALDGDPAAAHPDAIVVSDSRTLYTQLKQWLFRDNLDLVIPDLQRSAGASAKVSWNAVAAAFSQALNRLYTTGGMRERVVREAETFFSDADSPIYGQLTMEEFRRQGRTGFFSRRRGCCLWWRSPRANDYCSNCILLPQQEQDRRFGEMLDGIR
jgi:ferric iron reductase protein FhuF